eukprot:7577469-Pyramimonas_sp.AAC.1
MTPGSASGPSLVSHPLLKRRRERASFAVVGSSRRLRLSLGMPHAHMFVQKFPGSQIPQIVREQSGGDQSNSPVAEQLKGIPW